MKKEAKLVSFMDRNLLAFSKTLERLNLDNNLVLGGSNALMLHGIQTKKTPEDVDIVIYQATDRQLDFLETLQEFSTLGSSGKVFKFKISRNNEDYTLDILLEDGPLPSNLLYYIKGNIKVRIQDVFAIIKAKADYKRNKDLIDLLDLKNLNFNLN